MRRVELEMKEAKESKGKVGGEERRGEREGGSNQRKQRISGL